MAALADGSLPGYEDDGDCPLDFELPDWGQFLWTTETRYQVLYGGRGSGKSWTVAAFLILVSSDPEWGKLRIGCFRELQKSIKDSSKRLLADTIDRLGLGWCFKILETSITCTITGSEFLFMGLRHNAMEIKSTEGIDIAWVEEAQSVSRESWELLDPTIRKEGSRVILTYNPYLEEDHIHQEFVVHPHPDAEVLWVNLEDNPFAPQNLWDQRNRAYERDPDTAEHVWGGRCKKNSEAQILKNKWTVEEFEPDPLNDRSWGTPYYGADWGFSVDPTALVKLWIRKEVLYIEAECGGVGIELDDLPDTFDGLCENIRKNTVWADNSRPETISYMCRQGFKVKGAPKWSGSIEEGVTFLRSFKKIVIHPRCKEVQQEARNYSYKVDKNGEVTSTIVDAHNHYIDAIRYALAKWIKKSGTVDYERLTQE